MAARETGKGAGETFMHTGKLLALDVLVKVLTNPAHDWSQVRREFSQQLRQPLCLSLLRNCISPYDEAIQAAVSILTAIITVQRLREFLKAEIGALYPLLFLRPLEAERPESPQQVLSALNGLASLCASPQILVDIFINYDCNLQSANIFERTMKLLAKYVNLPMVGGPLPSVAVVKARVSALKALLAAIKSMDTWAGPLKAVSEEGVTSQSSWESVEKIKKSIDAEEAAAAAQQQQPQQAQPLHLNHDVLQKIQTDKAMKASLEGGIEVFNSNPVKGLKVLVGGGAVAPGAQAAADFLRSSAERLDPAAVGELLGHHDEESIAVSNRFFLLQNI